MGAPIHTGFSKTAKIAFGVAAIGILIPDYVLRGLMDYSPLFFLREIIPGVGKIAAASSREDYYSFLLGSQWLFVPIYFYWCVKSASITKISDFRRVCGKIFVVDGKVRVKKIVAVLFFGVIPLADIFHLHLPSIYWGTDWSERASLITLSAINSVPLYGAFIYFAAAIAQAFVYFVYVSVLLAGISFVVPGQDG